jgi:anti-sigma factor RsiW
MYISRQPAWTIKAGLVAAAAVMSAIAAILIIPALVIGFGVLVAAGGIARLRHHLDRFLPRSDGRRNVRVIARQNGQF